LTGRVCPICGRTLVGARADAEVCGPSCRRDRTRLRRILDGEPDASDSTVEDFVGRLRITLKSSGDFNVLTVQQVEAVADKAGIELTPAEAEQYRTAIVVAAYTGLRTGELRALRWRDVDFVAATIHVRSNKPIGGEEKAPKSDQVRSVPLRTTRPGRSTSSRAAPCSLARTIASSLTR
jgi:integrase